MVGVPVLALSSLTALTGIAVLSTSVCSECEFPSLQGSEGEPCFLYSWGGKQPERGRFNNLYHSEIADQDLAAQQVKTVVHCKPA